MFWNLRYLKKAFSGAHQTSKIKLFPKIVKGFQLLTIFAKDFNLDVWQFSEYATAYCNKVLGVRKIVYVS